MSKKSFKMFMKKAFNNACFEYLISEKAKLSKGSDIIYCKLETQSYLSSESGLSIENMRRIYQIRCRELPVKKNYPHAFKDVSCLHPDCGESDSQIHIFSSNCFAGQNVLVQENVNYSDIFGNDPKEQVKIANIMFSKLQNRMKFITLSDGGFPMDPSSKKMPKLGNKKAKRKNKRKRFILTNYLKNIYLLVIYRLLWIINK